nr:hypothetical protein HmN_000135700 [Hymenolepis microstoma]
MTMEAVIREVATLDLPLVLLRRPIIWVKQSVFDRATLIWLVYNSEFVKWNEHLQQLDALSSETTMPSSRGTEKAQQCTSSSPGLAFYTPERPLRLVPTPSLSSPSDGSSTAGSLPKHTTSAPQQQPPVSIDLGICLPTNILQLGSQSMELDSRTATVLTLEQSRISAYLRGSLVSESEFTDFCLRFDDDFNVGSDDWKPDKARSTVTVNENHLVVMFLQIIS